MEWNLEAGEEVVKQVGTVFIGHDDPLREAISERENQKGMEEGALYKRNPIALLWRITCENCPLRCVTLKSNCNNLQVTTTPFSCIL